ncbi:MAG: hypothetical protein ACXV8R_17160 [Acidimicrobiia bacterium]
MFARVAERSASCDSDTAIPPAHPRLALADLLLAAGEKEEADAAADHAAGVLESDAAALARAAEMHRDRWARAFAHEAGRTS